jgi:hypothetical protein
VRLDVQGCHPSAGALHLLVARPEMLAPTQGQESAVRPLAPGLPRSCSSASIASRDASDEVGGVQSVLYGHARRKGRPQSFGGDQLQEVTSDLTS